MQKRIKTLLRGLQKATVTVANGKVNVNLTNIKLFNNTVCPLPKCKYFIKRIN